MLTNQKVLEILSRPRFISHNELEKLLEWPSQDKSASPDGGRSEGFYDTDDLSGYLDLKHKTFYLISGGIKPLVKYCPLCAKIENIYYPIAPV